MATALLGASTTIGRLTLAAGGFEGRRQQFLSDLIERIRHRVPGAEVRKVLTPPVAGSALIALDLLAGTQVSFEVEERLKDALISWTAR